MIVIFSKLKSFWSNAVANINIQQIQHIKWKNCRAAPDHAYIPTNVEHCANILTHGVLIYLFTSLISNYFLNTYFLSPGLNKNSSPNCLCCFIDHQKALVQQIHDTFHIVSVCVAPSVLGLLKLLKRSQNIAQFWAGFVYGASLILIFTVSTSFHCVFFCSSDRQLRDFLHRCDRAVIYIFIAASYFPWVTLRSCPEDTIASNLNWTIWVLALCGIFYQQIFHEKYKKLETFFYIFMGVVPALTVLNNWTDFSGFKEIQLGGFIYGVGIIFFKMDGAIPCAHAIWHLFVAAAAGVHYRAILHYLYPTPSNDKNSINEKLNFY